MSEDNISSGIEDFDESPSLVAGAKRRQLTTFQKLGVGGLIAFVFLAFIWVDHALQAKNAEKPPEIPMKATAAAFKPAPMQLAEPAVPPAPTTTDEGKKEEMTPEESPLFAFTGGSGASGGGTGMSGSMMPSFAPQPAQPGGQIVPPLGGGGSGGPGGGGSNPATAISSQMTPTPTLPRAAVLLPHPHMLLTKGTIIPCTLQTAINTTVAGFVKCVIPEQVRSTTGSVVLLDRGTTVVGEIQQGLQNGQRRVFILWDRVETPNHAILALASPGADDLGRSGVPGSINNHFWQRFGAALMFSIIDGGMQAGTAALSNSGGNGNYTNSFQSSGQRLADSALQSTINIKPTLEKNQGSTVSIFVANDIDFSTIYELGAVK